MTFHSCGLRPSPDDSCQPDLTYSTVALKSITFGIFDLAFNFVVVVVVVVVVCCCRATIGTILV